MAATDVYGIGNPLIDVLVSVSDEELAGYGLAKGTMSLIDPERGEELLASLTRKEKRYSCGGSCPNTMIALAACGASSALAGKIGNDELGPIYHDRLSAHGVFSDLKTHEGPTGTSIIMVTPESERTMNTHLGANRFFTREDVSFDKVEGARMLHFTGYMWDTEPQKAAVLEAIDRAKRHGTTIAFDVADPFAVERNTEAFLRLIEEHADIVFANTREAELLLGIPDPEEAVDTLGRHCRYAVVKDGARGSFIKESGERRVHIPAAPARAVIDTTGAGDVYAAGFLYGLLREESAANAGAFAAFVASKIIQQMGAQLSDESVREVVAAFASRSYRDAVFQEAAPSVRS